jgi:tetratricopeptide (TPR) repeat protein
MSDQKRRQQSPRSRPRDAPRADPTGPPRQDAARSGSGLHPSVEADGAERWVSGKNEEQLLADLRAYLARLRDDPHNIQDRLRVAAIQLRLGRVDEALIHYEGVVRGYVAHGQIISAIALCERILGIYPDLAHLQKLLAALYARAPRGSVGPEAVVRPRAVTPIALESYQETPFVVADGQGDDPLDTVDPEDASTERSVVVDRLFAAPQQMASTELDRAALLEDHNLRPTMRFDPVQPEHEGSSEDPIPLTHPKATAEVVEPDPEDDGAPVVLLTQPKRRRE